MRMLETITDHAASWRTATSVRSASTAIWVVGALHAAAATAQPAVLADSDAWRFEATGYLFTPLKTTGTSTVDGVSADLDLDLGDVLEVLNIAGSARLEGWKHDFGFIVDGNYLSIGDDAAVTLPGPIGAGLGVDIAVRQGWVSVLGAWRFAKGALEDGRRFAFDVQAGGRYNAIKQEIDTDGPAMRRSFGGTEQWVEPLFGLRGAMQISDRWTVAAMGDIGGFGVGDNDLTWSLSAGVDYRPWQNTAIKFGYRYYSIAFSTRRSDGEFAYDISQHGPFVGVSYTWN